MSKDQSAFDLLRRPEIDYASLTSIPKFSTSVTDPDVIKQVEIHAKYFGYIERQHTEIERQRYYEDLKIPDNFSYKISGLSAELQQKLTEAKPATIGMAQRISGVTPAAISLLLIFLKKRKITVDKERTC